MRKGVVCQVTAHMINVAGQPVEQYSDLVMGISLKDLKKVKWSISVVSSAKRAAGLVAVLAGGYVNVVVTNESIAKALLPKHSRAQKRA